MSGCRFNRPGRLLAGLLLSLVLSLPAAGQDLEPGAALKASQAALGTLVGDHAFRDTAGQVVRLSELPQRPTVVSLIYTSCTHTCPMITQSLLRSVRIAQKALGEESFQVLTIGFDSARDTPAQMRAYASEQRIDRPNWHVLSGDGATIEALSEQLGFLFQPGPQGFDHLNQTTILDPDRRIYRQVYGATIEPPSLVEPLKDLVLGRGQPLDSVQAVIDRVRLLCTVYDPNADRYRFDYSLFIGAVIGFLSLSLIGGLLLRAWLAQRRADARWRQRNAAP